MDPLKIVVHDSIVVSDRGGLVVPFLEQYPHVRHTHFVEIELPTYHWVSIQPRAPSVPGRFSRMQTAVL